MLTPQCTQVHMYFTDMLPARLSKQLSKVSEKRGKLAILLTIGATFVEARTALEACEAKVGAMALFSSNEEADDVLTSQLKFLLISHLLGELLSSTPELKPGPRSAHLKQSTQQHSRFLLRLEQYGLLPPAAVQQWNVFREGGADMEDGSVMGEHRDPAAARADKIARFKARRAAKSRLEALQDQQGRRQAGRSTEDNAMEEADDDRELWLLQLELAALQSADQLTALSQELHILQQAPPDVGTSGAHAAAGDAMPRADGRQATSSPAECEAIMAQLRLAAGGLQGLRQQVAGSVLGPSHNLPTRTLAQQAQIEMERAQHAQAYQQAQAEARTRGALSDEDDEEQVVRQRHMDDYLDEHPRGWGNSKLRPCA
ncbi:hypothetical protein WJX73_004547 [Symbiochloris irregularis]|uniref:Uncharacterized protein n=1 Tax=Symbiochloris irregularis TaxID=706552 RepID=A0AAW1NWA2_9CHLO